MKKFMITCLAMAFLLPAFASAEDSYCVSFPKGGNSKWSTRDNVIQVRFRYGFREEDTNVASVSSRVKPSFWQSSGIPKGSKGTNKKVSGYTTHQYGAGDLCIYNPTPNFGKVSAREPKGKGFAFTDWREITPTIKDVRLDVKWGGDCDKVVTITKDGRLTGTHRFEIYRRKGDHINPFGCRRIR